MEVIWNQIKILELTRVNMGTGEEQVEHSYIVGITVLQNWHVLNRYIYGLANSHFNQRCKKTQTAKQYS